MKKWFMALLVAGWQAGAAVIPPETTQAIIGIAEGWDSSHASISLVEKEGGRWRRVLGPVPARLGSRGLVWGLGLHPNGRAATIKKEGDGRSPAGVFALGGVWTTQNDLRLDRAIPVVRVCERDLWVSDLNSPSYNCYVRLDHPAASAWEKKEQMHLNDAAHSIKMLIRHNTSETKGRPVRGAGSSIFFHIWRQGGAYPTAGCTAMAEVNLRAILARLKASRHPVYVLLPSSEYVRLRPAWGLP